MRKRTYWVLLLILLCSSSVFSQTNGQRSNEEQQSDFIRTASNFLNEVAERYAEISDMKAFLEMTVDSEYSEGTIFVKPPNNMRINFKVPHGQVINNNSEEFYIYIPKQNVALHQKKQRIETTGSVGSLITRTGLDLLIKNYLISYLDKPEFMLLSEDTDIKVIKIRLTWKNTSQNFREIILSVGEDLIIYQVDAVTYNRSKVQFIFSNIEINKGIPDSRFDYDPPATALVSENFLFDEEGEE